MDTIKKLIFYFERYSDEINVITKLVDINVDIQI